MAKNGLGHHQTSYLGHRSWIIEYSSLPKFSLGSRFLNYSVVWLFYLSSWYSKGWGWLVGGWLHLDYNVSSCPFLSFDIGYWDWRWTRTQAWQNIVMNDQEILCYWWNKTCCIKLSGTQHDRAVNVILHFPLLRLGWMIIVSIFHVISTFINFLYNFQHQKLTQNRSCDKWGGEAEVVSKILFKYFG